MVTPIDAAELVRLARYELALALSSADSSSPMRFHVAWHDFQPWFGSGDPAAWADEISVYLIPRLYESSEWRPIAEMLVPLVKYLRVLDPTLYYGCAQCS